MQNLDVRHTDFKKFCLVTDNLSLIKKTDTENVIIYKTTSDFESEHYFNVMIVDYAFCKKHNQFEQLRKNASQFVLITDEEVISASLFVNCVPDAIISETDYSEKIFITHDQIVNENRQNETYLNLAAELNSEYENIKKDLEIKLDETKIDLLLSRQKILESNTRTEAMRRILFAITQESDLHRIETILNELLPASSKATWIKIIPKNQKNDLEIELAEQLNTTFKSYNFADHFIFFIKGDQKVFKKDDLNLFSKIKEVIEINYNREINYTTLARTENIVRKAFEEFNHPLAVINNQYEIIQANKAFGQVSAHKKYCYEVLFNSNSPCTNCNLGSKYTTTANGNVFDVYSNSISIDNNPTKLWINLYKNKTEEHHFEQRLNQTAKMKELGIISSSIAHELNNPIGGILSYLQLIQMDLAKDHPLSNDIAAMINTTLRMKKIIEDLLIFSRTNNFKDNAIQNVAELIAESLSIHEIQLKNENIKIINHTQNSDLKMSLSKAAFRDAMHFIFSFYIEKIKVFRKLSSQKTGLVEVKFTAQNSGSIKQKNFSIEFQGNCGSLDEIDKSKDISLLALSKCLTDQGMHLEISAPSENWISLKVVIQKS